MSDYQARFNTLQEIFEHATASFAERPLYGVKRDGTWQWSTYADFRHDVERARTGLAGLGVKAGDRVAIISGNRPEWAIVAYAVYGLDAAVVPMYESQRPEDWAYIIADSGASVVVCSSAEIAAGVESHRDTLPTVQHVVTMEGPGESVATWIASDGPVVEPAPVSPDDIAGFVYTSGTTGNPKGVVLTHGNFARNVSAVTEVFPLPDYTRTLSFLPWAHAFGQTVELHMVMSLGLSTAFAESVPKIVDNLAEVRPTMLVSVPTIFTRIYEGVNKQIDARGGVAKKLFGAAIATAEKRTALAAEGRRSAFVDARLRLLDKVVLSKVRERFGGRLEYAITGGAAIPTEVAKFIDALGIAVYEGYGLSETSPIVTANRPGARKIGTVGQAIPGVRVEIDTSTGLDDNSGEIVVYGHCVMKGYHNLPEEDAKVFTADGGFRTGDIGRLDSEGFLSIVGRVKEQYKLANGKYVVPGPIEERLGLSRFITNAMVYGDNKPYNVALVVPNESELEEWARNAGRDLGTVTDDSEVRQLLEGEIATTTQGAVKGYESIRRFTVLIEDFTIENGLLTPTLKVKRNAVIARYESEIETLYK